MHVWIDHGSLVWLHSGEAEVQPYGTYPGYPGGSAMLPRDLGFTYLPKQMQARKPQRAARIMSFRNSDSSTPFPWNCLPQQAVMKLVPTTLPVSGMPSTSHAGPPRHGVLWWITYAPSTYNVGNPSRSRHAVVAWTGRDRITFVREFQGLTV